MFKQFRAHEEHLEHSMVLSLLPEIKNLGLVFIVNLKYIKRLG